MELLAISSKRRTEVLCDASNQRIEAFNQVKIEIVFSDGEGPDLILKLLQGLRPDVSGPAGQNKTQERVTLSIGSDPCLLRTQREPQLSQDQLDLGPSLFGLGAACAQHHEVVGIAHEAKAEFVQVPVQPIENDVSQQWGDNSPLWRTLGGSQELTVHKDSAAEEAFEEVEHCTISNTFSNGV